MAYDEMYRCIQIWVNLGLKHQVFMAFQGLSVVSHWQIRVFRVFKV